MLLGINSINNGVVFLIKQYTLLILILISGCAVNNFNDLGNSYRSIKDLITTQTIDVNELDLTKKLSYAIVQFNNDDELSAEIVSIKTNKVSWQTQDNIILEFQNGKITKTRGLEHDYSIIFNTEFKEFSGLYSGYIRFKNPDSNFLEITSSFKEVESGFMDVTDSLRDIEYILIEESFSVPLIKWSGKNYYWIDTNNNVLNTKQILDPFNTKINFQIIKK